MSLAPLSQVRRGAAPRRREGFRRRIRVEHDGIPRNGHVTDLDLLQRLAGNRKTARLVGESAQRAAGASPAPAGVSVGIPVIHRTPAADVIRRRMGFEFETHAHIYRTDHNYNELVADEAEIYQRPDWKLVSDSGRMEFVSEPLNTLNDAVPVIAEMDAFIQNSKVALGHDIRNLNQVGNWLAAAGPAPSRVTTSDDENNRVQVNDQSFYGNPQVSLGVRMESLSRFLSKIDKAVPMKELRDQLFADKYGAQQHAFKKAKVLPNSPIYPDTTGERIGAVGQLLRVKDVKQAATSFPKAERLIDRHAGAVPALDQDKLRGLWQLMTRYWQWLDAYKIGGGYIKAQLPTMARTDFHSMYNELGAPAQAAFAAARSDFVGINIPLLTRGESGDPLVQGHPFSIGDWYDSIIQPPQGSQHTHNNVARGVDLVSNDQTVATGTNKSMGQIGIDANNPLARRAVFELRRVTGGVNVPLSYMQPHILTPIDTLLQSVNG